MTGPCLFCGENSAKVSREHTWPDWLNRVLPLNVGEEGWVAIRSGVDEYGSIGGSAYVVGKRVNQTVRMVCVSCNGGWMSRLEVRAKPLMLPLILGQPTVVSAADQIVLATWAVKTAMVFDFVLGQTPLFSQEARATIRKEDRPPSDAMVRVVAFAEGDSLDVQRVDAVGEGSEAIEDRMAVFTLLIGRIAFQVSYARQASKRNESLLSLPATGPSIASLYPPTLESLPFPLPEELKLNDYSAICLEPFTPTTDMAAAHSKVHLWVTQAKTE